MKAILRELLQDRFARVMLFLCFLGTLVIISLAVFLSLWQ